MKQTHTTLRPNTNIVLIFMWGFLCSFLLYSNQDKPYLLLICGIFFGLIAGGMQTLSFNEAKESFLDASTMLEVRQKLKETIWGKRYLYFLWGANAVLVGLALMFTLNPIPAIMVGYFALMFIREIITLKPTYDLSKLQKRK